MKAYTDLEQSKKLAEFLPLESADMMYHSVENEYGSGAFVATSKVITNGFKNDDFYTDDIPCWSLAALFNILSNVKLCHYNNKHFCQHIGLVDDFPKYSTFEYDNPVDACVEMILKLHEQNLL